MAKSVNDAFNEFNKEIVNLDSERTKIARSSRDWLIGQLTSLPDKLDDFPKLYAGMHIKFGSFARNTKIRPLDDIDLLLTFSGEGATYSTIIYGQNYILSVPQSATLLRKLCNHDGTLNSIKVVNKIVSSLNQIEHYKKAEIHRRHEAATLDLNSYEWSFDIVPAFYTDTNYYIIPDGQGGWKATDPRKDQDRITTINQEYGGSVLQLVRILKYWNNVSTTKTIPSYLFETIVLNFVNDQKKLYDYIDVNVISFWQYLKTAILADVGDPKGFQGNINSLIYTERRSISSNAEDAYKKGYAAYKFETEEDNQEKSINKWGEIFGKEFPKYE